MGESIFQKRLYAEFHPGNFLFFDIIVNIIMPSTTICHWMSGKFLTRLKLLSFENSHRLHKHTLCLPPVRIVLGRACEHETCFCAALVQSNAVLKRISAGESAKYR